MKILFEKWWRKNTKHISLINYKKAWKENNIGRQWGIKTNGARKELGHTCFDLNIYMGYLLLNYTNWAL